jgi:H+/Cl- antiporter ClcA
MDNYKQDSLSSIGLRMDDEVKQQLMESSKWTKFISILMVSFCGILLIGGIMGSASFMLLLEKFGGFGDNKLGMLAGYGAGIIIAAVVFIVILLVVIYYFLYRFATQIKTGIITENVQSVNSGFSALKTHIIIVTILSIIMLLISVANLFN